MSNNRIDQIKEDLDKAKKLLLDAMQAAYEECSDWQGTGVFCEKSRESYLSYKVQSVVSELNAVYDELDEAQAAVGSAHGIISSIDWPDAGDNV